MSVKGHLSLVARLGLGVFLVAVAVLASAPLQVVSKTATGKMTVTALVTRSCLITSTSSTAPSYVRVSCPAATSPFRIYKTGKFVNVVF